MREEWKVLSSEEKKKLLAVNISRALRKAVRIRIKVITVRRTGTTSILSYVTSDK